MEAINKSTEPITAAALLQKPEDGYRYELVQGELVHYRFFGIYNISVPICS